MCHYCNHILHSTVITSKPAHFQTPQTIFQVMHSSKKVIFLRSIQSIGYLHKTFDFDQKEIVAAKKVNFNIKEETYEKLLSLVPIEMLGKWTQLLVLFIRIIYRGLVVRQTISQKIAKIWSILRAYSYN